MAALTDAFVLVGGASRRMGREKCRIVVPSEWGRVPLAVRVWLTIRAAGVAQVRLVGRPGDRGWCDPDGVPIEALDDLAPDAGRHPLWGVAAALEATAGPACFVAPGDSWGLTAEAVRRLIEGGGIAEDPSGRLHPLLGVWPVGVRDRAVAIARAQGPVRDAVIGVPRVSIDPLAAVDLDEPGQVPDDGLSALVSALPLRDGADEGKILASERARLRSRGAL